MKPWHEANAEAAEGFAREQQSRLETVLSARVRALAEWVEEAEGKYQAGEKVSTSTLQDLPSDSFYTGLGEDDAPFALSEKEREAVFSAGTRGRLAALKSDIDRLEKDSPPEPPMANAVSEDESVEQNVFVRGSYKREARRSPSDSQSCSRGRTSLGLSKGAGARSWRNGWFPMTIR